MERQRCPPEKLLIRERSGTQYVAIVRELLRSYCGNVLQRIKHFRYKLAELSLIVIFEQNLTIIERNEIFDNGKQNFYSHTDYNLFMLQNGLDRKEAIFVIVPL